MIRYLYILSVFALFCVPAEAWTPDAWPAKLNSPRETVGTGRAKDYWAKDCYSSICERASAGYAIKLGWNGRIPHPDAPRFFRSEHGNLWIMKHWVTNYARFFVDPTQMGTNGNFNVWMNENKQVVFDPHTYTWVTNYPDSFPTFSNLQSLVTAARVPANFFSVTFWRDIGGFADLPDDEILPGYDRSDYGWDGLRRVITNLYCAPAQARPIGLGVGVANYWGGYGESTNFSSTNCLERNEEARSMALGAGTYAYTNVHDFAGFLSRTSPDLFCSVWIAAKTKYDVGLFPNVTTQVLTKAFKLYLTTSGNTFVPAGRYTYAEDVVVNGLLTNGISANAYGESGFVGWPATIDCDTWMSSEFDASYKLDDPLAYVEFSGFIYE